MIQLIMSEQENAIDRFTGAMENWITSEVNKQGVKHGEISHAADEAVRNLGFEEAERLNHEASKYIEDCLKLVRIREEISSFMERITDRLRPFGTPPVEILSVEILFPESEDSES